MANTANQGQKTGERWHNSKENHGPDVSVLAELLILGIFEVIAAALKPSAHAGNTLVILETVALQSTLTRRARILICLVDVFVLAEWHKTQRTLR